MLEEEIAKKRKKNEKEYDYFEVTPDGGRRYVRDRRAIGRNGGYSRITKTVDKHERTLEVKHESWRGDQDPSVDAPYHIDFKSIRRR